jgi:small-conductance mechanosensitive channel
MLAQTFLGIPLSSWLTAVAAAVLAYVVLRVVLSVLQSRLSAIAAKTATQWDDMVVGVLSRTKPLFLIIVGIYFGARFLALPDRYDRMITDVAVLTLLLQSGIWISAGFSMWLTAYTKRELETDRGAATTMSALGFIVKLAVWSVILLVALDSLGFKVSTWAASPSPSPCRTFWATCLPRSRSCSTSPSCWATS